MHGSSPGGPLAQLDEYVEQLRQKLPAAPPALMDGYVQWVPWLAIGFGAFVGLFSLLGLVGGMALSPLLLLGGASGVQHGVDFFITLGVVLIGSLLDVGGGYLMLRRSATGWWLVAVGLVISALSNLVSFSVFGFVISAVIAYIHVEVRPRYV